MLIDSAVPRRVLRRGVSRAAVPSMFEGFVRGRDSVHGVAPAGVVPCIDVTETGEALLFSAELPGVSDADCQVIVDGDVITIKGEKKVALPEERAGTCHLERSRGAFSRAFRLAFDVDPDSVSGSLKNGVLTVTVPKPDDQKLRTIPVTAG